MIEDIQIRDLGVIGDAHLEFHPGLTVLTGETGAGKTMVLTALGLLLGARADSGMIRAGSSQAILEGRWKLKSDNPAISIALDAGALVEDSELLMVRTVGSDSRSKAVIGGRAAPVGLLTEISEHLVVVHGQSDQIRLKSPIAQREALDRFAGLKQQELLARYTESYSNWRKAKSELDAIQQSLTSRTHESAELAEALTLLEKLAIQPNEDIELADLAKRLTHSEDLRAAVGLAHEALVTQDFDGTDVIGLLGKARKSIEAAASHDSSLEPAAQSLRDSLEVLSEVAIGLASYLTSLEGEDSRSLDEIQARRSEITSALRRFGPSIEDLKEFEKTSQQRLLELDSSTERIEELTKRLADLEKNARDLALEISTNRVVAAKDLGERVTSELVSLAMAGSKLHVLVEQGQELAATGLDTVSFLLESYAGAEPRPLGKGASGGELSRIMLAIEVILAETDTTPTFIFDEVDAGVGGAAAIEVGRRLGKLAKNAQVIVVTHLAQVAAFADQHLAIEKTSNDLVTSSDVKVLDEAGKTEELARMLSGLSGSTTAREHAIELMQLTKKG